MRRRPPGKKVGIWGDLVFLLVLVACLLLPVHPVPEDWSGPAHWKPGLYNGWDQLTPRFVAPALLVWIYCSAGEGCATARLLASPALVTLGGYSLEVYLFQTPLREALLWLKVPGGPLWPGLPWTNEVFIAYLLVLWFASGCFVELVVGSVTRRLRQATAALNARPGYRPVNRGSSV